MESFIDTINHKPTRNKFIGAISNKKPFTRFKDMFSQYPDLREQWFAFKLQNYIEFIQRQLEISNMLNDPITGFYIRLRYHLSRAFQSSRDKKIRTFWCDWVWPVDSPLSIQSASKTRRIETQAVMGWLGHTRQEKYEMIIKLGPEAVKKHKEGLSILNCLPGDESLDWVTVDFEKKTIELQLN